MVTTSGARKGYLGQYEVALTNSFRFLSLLQFKREFQLRVHIYKVQTGEVNDVTKYSSLPNSGDDMSEPVPLCQNVWKIGREVS